MIKVDDYMIKPWGDKPPSSCLLSKANGGILTSNVLPSPRSILKVPLKYIVHNPLHIFNCHSNYCVSNILNVWKTMLFINIQTIPYAQKIRILWYSVCISWYQWICTLILQIWFTTSLNCFYELHWNSFTKGLIWQCLTI